MILHIGPDTQQHLLWLESGMSLIYEGPHLPQFYSHDSHYLGLSNYLQLPEHPCHFTSSYFCPHSFFWLEYHCGSFSPTIPIHLAWSASHISPGSLPLSASLQGKVVHSFFWVYIISLHTIFIVFMILYSSMYPLTYKNNKLWLWVRHWDKCREHNGEKDTGSFWPLFSYNLHPVVITYDSHISSSDSREGRKPSLLIFYFPLLIPSTGIQ